MPSDVPADSEPTPTVESDSAAPLEASIEEGSQEASAPESSVPTPPPVVYPESVLVNDLQSQSLGSLQALSNQLGWRFNGSRSKHQLISELLAWMLQHGTRVYAEGFLEMQQENFGLLRYPRFNFKPLPEDVFIPIFAIKKFGLRAGQKLRVSVKVPRDKEKYLAMDRIEAIEDSPLETWQHGNDFDRLTATFPAERIILETPKQSSVSARLVDLMAPLGKGQRALIVASPRSGKTMLLKEIAKSIKTNHSEIHLMVLLLDERPEEVTDFEETVEAEIFSSTFDESSKRHAQVSEIVLERAKRLVEMGKDVVILLDSITRLARGYNTNQGGKGRTMSGGMDSKAMIKPKKFFGAARKVEEGGSLTIIATALVDTESRMDELIFEEFKGTGNMEISLDREIAERRIYPAIHVLRSGTRRDELLYDPEEFRRLSVIRRQLASVPAMEALEWLIRNIERSKSNAELLLSGLKS